MDFSFIQMPKGIEMREPYQSEIDYFGKNKNVAGMATEDGKVILNPYAGLKPEEYQSVATNEAARVLIKQEPSLRPDFQLTDSQASFLDSSTYRNASDEDRKATIAARLLSGDPSAGIATAEQSVYIDTLKRRLFSNGH